MRFNSRPWPKSCIPNCVRAMPRIPFLRWYLITLFRPLTRSERFDIRW